MSGSRLEPTPEGIETAADCICDGGVVVAPSDTNLALTLDPWNEAAIERAFRIKNREPTDPLTLFIRDPADWERWATTDREAAVDTLVDAFWPGPLNIILEKTERVPDRVVAGGETVALGCLSNPTWRGLSAAVDQPLCMTSANLTGQADGQLVDLDLAIEQVGDRVDYILDGEAQGTTQSSTIVDLTDMEPTILRHGDITATDLDAAVDGLAFES
ncbi:threonylcarbamoyl-AMP synthase [Halonotius aquaticus]|jgi:L-threonylcarbamoyladenylate synthase|uniref:L-threonylcarbamoyladenylate synthase n=1 Tax=Halonotius aquaticus TaxID=2216978 RepID=A0A3A6PPM0_9EURY|nr:L-threonylcarbamoyladenylate synthase [Halonotius aquaticus]RJX44178.1 threonylcarbamoyl-AMP synthase [Halonotius aquaticus]